MDDREHRHHHHHRHRHHRHGRRLLSRKQRKAVAAGVVLVVVVGALVIGVRAWESSQFAVDENLSSNVTVDTAYAPLKTVEVDGATYRQRKNVGCYLVLGVDVLEEDLGAMDAYNGGGQSDFMALIVVDDAARTWCLLHINRDSMVQVPVLNFAGRVTGYETQQIALAYAYGADDYLSCRNAVNTVSALLLDQDIDGYLSMEMDDLAAINDRVGGVTLTVSSDFSSIDSDLVQGSTQTLTGAQAVEYVRSRYGVDDETNMARMERQRQYMTALLDRVKALTDDEVVDLYETVAELTYTNIGSGTFADLAQKLVDYEQLPTVTLPGTNVEGSRYMEYRLDEEGVRDVALSLFYEEVGADTGI